MNYYDENSAAFISQTLNVDLTKLYQKFLPHIPKAGKILDAGCGSGRDTKQFRELGYEVCAFDASSAMAEHAQSLTGIVIKRMVFSDVNWEAEFDGVWACASLLHEPPDRFTESVTRLVRALKPSGAMFISVKHGSGPKERDGRYFCDYTEIEMQLALRGVKDISSTQYWITKDQRSDQGRPDWLNVLALKTAA